MPSAGSGAQYTREVLYGRERELAQLAALLEQARAGSAGVLVLLGEPGVGKSALMRDLVSRQSELVDGDGVRVLSTAGVESESPLAFSALHRLLRPVLELERLPAPQARALRHAFGLEEGPPVEPFMVGVATLSALTDAAEQDGPLLCVVDDAQWLDSASANALLFAARQLAADPVAMVFAARTLDTVATDRTFDPQGLPVLELTGVDDAAARRLLDERFTGSVTHDVAHRLVRDCGGNPLALLELPTALSSAQLSGRTPLPRELTLTDGLELAFLDRCRRLDEGAQTLLLIVSAESSGRVGTVRGAATRLGVDGRAWEEAERSGLMTVAGQTVVIRHALVRSAVYQSATSTARRQVHRTLAEELAEDDPDRATWHHAAAAEGPDADIADALHQVGIRAERRGGHDNAAAAFERAAALTAVEPTRAVRLLAAALVAWADGQATRARALSASARTYASDELVLADIDRLRARIEIYLGSAADAHRMFVTAAHAVSDRDQERALDMAVAAALTSVYGGDSGAALPAEVLTGLSTPAEKDTNRTECLRMLLGALTASAAGDLAQAAVRLAHALETGRRVDDLDVLGNLGNAAIHLGDDNGALRCYSTMVSSARERGAGMAIIYGLERLAFPQFLSGRWTELRGSLDEALTLAGATGHPALTAAPLAWLTLLAALTGEADYEIRLTELDDVASRYPLGVLADPVHDLTRWAKGVRAAASGDAAGALHHLDAMRVPALQRMATMDRLEAAARTDSNEKAVAWTADLSTFANATNRAWALADLQVGRALFATDPTEATEAFEEALRHHGHASRPFQHARTQLAYGEFLRRTNRRVDSRIHLRAALETFADLGADTLLDRAAQEVRASGETARKRDPSTLLDLTPMERKVAQLVSTGLSNKEAAAQCWVSPRTVAFHLRNVFLKAGVTSRTELAQLNFG